MAREAAGKRGKTQISRGFSIQSGANLMSARFTDGNQPPIGHTGKGRMKGGEGKIWVNSEASNTSFHSHF